MKIFLSRSLPIQSGLQPIILRRSFGSQPIILFRGKDERNPLSTDEQRRFLHRGYRGSQPIRARFVEKGIRTPWSFGPSSLGSWNWPAAPRLRPSALFAPRPPASRPKPGHRRFGPGRQIERRVPVTDLQPRLPGKGLGLWPPAQDYTANDPCGVRNLNPVLDKW